MSYVTSQYTQNSPDVLPIIIHEGIIGKCLLSLSRCDTLVSTKAGKAIEQYEHTS